MDTGQDVTLGILMPCLKEAMSVLRKGTTAFASHRFTAPSRFSVDKRYKVLAHIPLR